MTTQTDATTGGSVQQYHAGDVVLECGATLADVRVAFQTFGRMESGRDVIVMPTYYTGTHRECGLMVGSGRALDPERHFIVIVNMLGNSESTSPSNAHPDIGGANFPLVSVGDNVRLQHQLLTQHLGVEQIALVVGWSMGAQQTFEWGARFPKMMRTILPICGSARTSRHNYVFLQGVKAALLADPNYDAGRYTQPPLTGLDAFGRVYCGWAYSQDFFRRHGYRDLGFESADELLQFWADDHKSWDANDLLAMLATWQHADISANATFNGDFERALNAIEARAIVMPCDRDLYFPPADSEYEVANMRNAELQVLRSDWGHIAGSPRFDPASKTVIDDAIWRLLEM